MSAKETAFANALLDMLFSNVDLANLGDISGLQNSAVPGNLTIALHTADPAGGDQTTSEATYTSYARVTVPRDPTHATGWAAAAAGLTDNVAAVTFPACTGGSNTITHVSLGNGASNEILYSGALDANLAVSSGITPEFAIGALNITES